VIWLKLVDSIKDLIIPFIRSADEASIERSTGQPVLDVNGRHRSVLVDARPPEQLIDTLAFSLPEQDGLGKDGLLASIKSILSYSVNTWDQGFLDKLYSSTNAVSALLLFRTFIS
jgi:glutamate decarboxylase